MYAKETVGSRIPLHAIHQLQHDLQTHRKCFSGAQLTHWILHHADLFTSPDDLSLCDDSSSMTLKEALAVAQELLDKQIILDIEKESSGN